MSEAQENQNSEENQDSVIHPTSTSKNVSRSFEISEVSQIKESGNFSSEVSLENEGIEHTNDVVEPRNFDDYRVSSMAQDITSYRTIQAGSFMNEEACHVDEENQNHSNVRNEDNLNQNQDGSPTSKVSNEMSLTVRQFQEAENENKPIFNPVTVLAPSTDSSAHQAAFPPTQAINVEENSAEHTILTASDISGFPDTFSNGTHYIVQGLQSIQAINQPGNSPVVLLQVPGTQNTNQVVVAQLANGQIQQANVPLNIAPVQTELEENMEQNSAKKGRGKGRARGRAKLPKLESTPLRPLAPRMFAVPISSSVLIAGPSGTSQVYNTVDQMQQMTSVASSQVTRTAGQHFEVLGRCVMCFRFCRTTTYCRAEKNHTDVRAAACAECEENGLSTVVCRRKRQHKSPNAHPPNIVINVPLQRAVDLKEMCVKNLLPHCFSELHSLTVHHADCIFAQPRVKLEADADDNLVTMEGGTPNESYSCRKPINYARGYLYPYSKEAWEQWLVKFCLQTGTSYRIRTGKRVNKKTDHGLANHNGKIVVYRALETQLYNCALGGKPRKKALREGQKRRKARGSKLIGCSAVIHTRLIVTEEDWKALEITLPKLSAHLPVHDPRITTNELQSDMSNIMLSSSLYGADQGVTTSEQEEFAILDDVSFHTNTETELTSDQIQFIGSIDFDSLRKQTKSLMGECIGLVDELSSYEALKSAHLHIQSFHNQLKRNTSQRRSRKRTAVEANLVEDEVLDEGESRPASVNQVVLLQADHD